MLKHITVPIIVDDHDPEKCSHGCRFYSVSAENYCDLYAIFLCSAYERCKECMEGAK